MSALCTYRYLGGGPLRPPRLLLLLAPGLRLVRVRGRAEYKSEAEAYRASLARSAHGPRAEEARIWILRLERVPPEEMGPELQPVDRPQEVNDEAWLHYGMAAIYDRRGEIGRAIEEAETAVAMAISPTLR